MKHRSPAWLATAIVAALAGCTRDTPLKSAGSPVDSAIARGEAVYLRGEFDSAAAIWRSALRSVDPTDPAAEPRLLTLLGLAAYRQGNYADARRLGERALSLKLARHLRPELPKSYGALGLLAWNEGRLADATRLLDQALTAAREVADTESIAKASSNLGLVQTELGAFDDARANFLIARAIGRARGDARIEGGALTNLGMLDIWTGDSRAAVASLGEALRLYRSVGYRTGEENALGQLGTAWAALGEPHLAFAMLDSALGLARDQGMRAEEAADLEAIADLYRELGDGQRALRTYAQAQAINEELGLQVELGNNLRHEATIRAASGMSRHARTAALAALRAHVAAGARYEELHDLLLLAELSAQEGADAEAERHWLRARGLADTVDSRGARAQVALTGARLAERTGNAAAVLRILDGARSDLEAGNGGGGWEDHALRARAHATLGALDSAVAAGRRAVAAVERVRGNVGSAALNTAYTAGKVQVYTDLVLALLRHGLDEEAFTVADAARGRALLEHLPSVRRQVAGAGPVEDLAAAEALLRRIDALVRRLGQTEEVPPGERAPDATMAAGEITHRLEQARAEYDAMLVRAAARRPSAAALLGARPASAAEVRAVLRPGEVLLEYLVARDRVLVFVMTRDTVRALESAAGQADLASRVRLARGLLGERETAAGDSRKVTEALYRLLLAPVESAGLLTGASRLLVVPHGVLGYLPFAALRHPGTGRAVADDYAVWSVPTAAALPAIRGRPDHEPAPPAYARAALYAPFPEHLPGTRGEIVTIGHTMPHARARVGELASEGDIRRALARGEVIHVASHGVLNPVNPLFSRVELVRRGSGASDDGRLEVHEVLSLRVRSPLVFLSGCETGLGPAAWSTDFGPGEDYATIAQSFLYAGARNVVATLWRIEDAGAAAFAERFYRALGHLSPPEALAAAQRDLRRDPRYAHPYYWAAYVLSGDGG